MTRHFLHVILYNNICMALNAKYFVSNNNSDFDRKISSYAITIIRLIV
jgi:hypothetical protein